MLFMKKVASPTVLLVDADAEQSRLNKNELEAQGYRVVCVDSGAEALAAFDHETIDAVVVDAFLPDMHVLDLVDEIATTRRRRTSIIINDTCPGYKQNFRYWAADAVIEKSAVSTNRFSQVAALL